MCREAAPGFKTRCDALGYTQNFGSILRPMTRHAPREVEQIDLVRLIESHRDTPVALPPALVDRFRRPAEFPARVLARAQWLWLEWDLDHVARQTRKRWRQRGMIMAAGMGALGGVTALQAIQSGPATVNFFWLLLTLLGTSTVSLLFWLGHTAWYRGSQDKPGGLALWLILWVRRGLSSLEPAPTPSTDAPVPPARSLARIWLSWQLSARVGYWRLSALAHGLWCVFLLGGLSMLLLALATRQYDFVWETTLLEARTFEQLTSGLGWLPDHLGFPVPQSGDVAISRLGALPADREALRIRWAGLLFGSLLIWGLLPRLLALGFSLLALRQALNQRQPDWQDPYFDGLQSELGSRLSQRLAVVDDDENPPARSGSVSPERLAPPSWDELPPGWAWLGLELGTPPAELWQDAPARTLGTVDDRASRLDLLDRLSRDPPSGLIVVSELLRLPDRGTEHFLRELVARLAVSRLRLLLLDPVTDTIDSTTRRTRRELWALMAQRVGLPVDAIGVRRIAGEGTA